MLAGVIFSNCFRLSTVTPKFVMCLSANFIKWDLKLCGVFTLMELFVNAICTPTELNIKPYGSPRAGDNAYHHISHMHIYS